jgi:hypothetical protein
MMISMINLMKRGLKALLLLFFGCGSPSEFPDVNPQLLNISPKPQSALNYQISGKGARGLMPPTDEVLKGLTVSHSKEGGVSEVRQDWNFQFSTLVKMVCVDSSIHRKLSDSSELKYSVFDFDYQLLDLRWFEADEWKDGSHDWDMEIGGEPVVRMKRNGMTRSDAMGLMRGDPRNWYLGKWSRARFLDNGEPWLEGGKLISAKTLDGPTDTASIGQYFLGGLKVEQWVHRLMLPLPRAKELSDGMVWKWPLKRWYSTPSRQPEAVERWTCRRGEDGHWNIEMKVDDRLGVVAPQGVHRPMRNWVFSREIKATLDKDDLMPLKIFWEESGQWQDEFPKVHSPQQRHGSDSTQKNGAKPLIHQWKQEFKVQRT